MKSRHAKILDRIAIDGEATVQGLAERFGVSVMTVRRDLAELENQHEASLLILADASVAYGEMQAEIERICQRLGLPADPRKFSPHVTLARLKNGAPLDVHDTLAYKGGLGTGMMAQSVLSADGLTAYTMSTYLSRLTYGDTLGDLALSTFGGTLGAGWVSGRLR